MAIFDDFIQDSDDWLSELYPARPRVLRDVRIPTDTVPPKASRRQPGAARNPLAGRPTAAAR